MARLNPERFKLKTIPLQRWLTYQRQYDHDATLLLVVDRTSNWVVGAEAISYQADTLINYLALLIQQRITPDQLHETFFAYPSIAGDLYGIWT